MKTIDIRDRIDYANLVRRRGCLFDTEYVGNIDHNCRRVCFFQRPTGQSFAAAEMGRKSFDATNLNQSSMLDYPRKFVVCGMNVLAGPTAPPNDIASVREGGVVKFIMSGSDVIFEMPLIRFPQSVALNKEFSRDAYIRAGNCDDVPHEEWSNPMVPISDAGRGYLIDPGYAFNVIIEWNHPPIVCLPVRLTCILEGWKYECARRVLDTKIQDETIPAQ